MRVLVAIDGSEPAGLAVDLVADAAWPAGTEILVAEAVESGAGLFGGPWPALAMVQADTLEAELRAEARRPWKGHVRDSSGPTSLSGPLSSAAGRPPRSSIERVTCGPI